MTDFDDALAAHIAAVMKRQAAVIEEACEKAIQGGRFGVLVETERTPWGSYRVTAKVDPSVPYGQIHEQ